MKKRILVVGLVLALVVVLVMPMAALAGNTGTTTVSGIQSNIIEVTAPSEINFNTFSIGVNNKQSTTAGMVTCNGNTWHVEAKDQANGGVMKTSGDNTLAGRLQISKDGSSWANADTGISYDSNPITLPFYVKQNVLATDKAGSYTITMTFTGTIDT